MSKSPNPDIIDKIYFRNIYSCQRKIYWYKVKVMETINAVWEHSYGEDCIPNFSANMEQPRHRWYEFKEGFSLTLVERAIRETKKDNKSTSFTVLDPFSGSGTSPLTALQSRCNAIGYEVNPFMSFVGKTKCQQRTKSIHDYTKELNRILVQRPFRLKSPLEGVSTFTGSGENGKWLFNLDVLRAYEALYQHISLSEYKDFFLLALITSAMQCCNAKKDGKCLRYLKNWKALNYTGANLRDTFKANALQKLSRLLDYCKTMRMSYSYKPILILALLHYGDRDGCISIENAAVYFREYYSNRKAQGLAIEKKQCIYLRDDVTDAQIIANLLSNPVKALIESGFFFYNEDSHVFSVSPDIWSTIDRSNKAAITRICRQKLKDYYKD